jgi:phage shock protein PspC (stress-responsive transcriptional regulator)
MTSIIITVVTDPTKEAVPRRLARRRRPRAIAGVAGGIADYTGVDVVLVRMAFIVLAALGGAGLVLYLLAWIAIPEEGEPSSLAGKAVLGRSRWLAIVLIAIAVFILLRLLDQWGSPFTWAIALIAVGVVLLQEEPAQPRSRTAPKATSQGPGTTEPAETSRVVRTRRARSPLGTYTVGATLLAVALGVALSSAGIIELDLGRYFALALLALGCGLIVGGWWGRTRIVILMGLLIVPFMLVASVIDVPLRGIVGSQYIDPRRQINDSYEVLAGSLTLDLSRYRFEETPTEVRVSFAAGDINVHVPPGVEVLTSGSVSLGAVDLFGDMEEGRDLDVDGVHVRPGLTEGTLLLDVRGGIGKVTTSWSHWVEQEKRRQARREERVENEQEEADEQPARKRDKRR